MLVAEAKASKQLVENDSSRKRPQLKKTQGKKAMWKKDPYANFITANFFTAIRSNCYFIFPLCEFEAVLYQ